MNLVKRLFHFDSDATLMEKIVTVVAAVGVAAIVFVLLLSSFGVFNNDISKAAHTAGAVNHIIGAILWIGAGFWGWLNWTDRVSFRINEVVAALLLALIMALAICFSTGFYVGQY